MTKDDFVNLPLKVALGVIWEAASSRLRDMPAPEVPRPPRYDGKLPRKGGFVWMSEMSLESLTWWEQKKRQSADEGGAYADKDRRTADTLAKWIEWRSIAPAAVWSGTRGEDKATAAPPSREPKLNAWPDNGASKGKGSGGTQSGDQSKENYEDDYE